MVTLRPYQQELYDRTVKAYNQGFKRPLIVAGCGSGKSYLFLKMAEHASKSGLVMILIHRIELKEQHIKLFKDNGIPMENIVIESVFTVVNHLDRYPKPRMIILDEAHLSRSNSWLKVISHFNTYCVAFTASPIRLDGKPLKDVYDTMIETVSVRWLIDNNYLCDYKYYAPSVVDVSKLKKRGGDFATEELEKTMIKPAIYGDVIEHYKKLEEGRKTIAYCVSVKHSIQTAEEFCKAGFKAKHIDGTTPKKERQLIVEQFRNGEIEILCNCMLIVEGISISDCDCCLLLRPTCSLALYIQSSMRCMRYTEDKEALILDFVGNYQRHGLPDDQREWSLESGVKQNSRFNEKGELVVRQCLNCYGTFKTAPVCPYCGFVYESTAEEIKQYKDIELQEIRAAQVKKVESYKAPEECTTRQELADYAKLHGYKPGWMWFQAQALNIYK